MEIPEFLLPYQNSGKSILKKVSEIVFSGSTYQVLVDREWVFLQLNGQGQLKDGFCSCEQMDEKGGCCHLACAFLKIWEKGIPLHRRFEESFWNQLCLIAFRVFGEDVEKFERTSKGQYRYQSPYGEAFFKIEADEKNGQNKLEELFFERDEETEETSLKFSNLAPAEMAAWKSGNPNERLLYLLSYWNDLAKWLMQLQDTENNYQIAFEPSQAFPEVIEITFPYHLRLFFSFPREQFTELIPALNTVDASLQVHRDLFEKIEGICYIPDEQRLLIQHKNQRKEEAGEQVGTWRFVPESGFFLVDEAHLLNRESLKGAAIAELFDQYPDLIQEKLRNGSFYPALQTVKYTLFFDPQWNLHLQVYLFSEGDLEQPHLFGAWAYHRKSQSFYHLEGLLFDKVEKIILKENVGDFVMHHREWLSGKKGFETHIMPIESQLSYRVDENLSLSFSRQLVEKKGQQICEFGNWIYLEGEGFYVKTSAVVHLPIDSGILIQADQIPLFIRHNQEELKLVPHFFSPHCPVADVRLDLALNDSGAVDISPHYQLVSPEEKVYFFENFSYVPGEGFFSLPAALRLPDRFHQGLRISPQQVPLFLRYELPEIRKLVRQIDPRLEAPRQLKLVADHLQLTKSGYALQLRLQGELGSIPISEIVAHVKKRKHFLFTPAGFLDISLRRFRWLKMVRAEAFDHESNTLTLSTIELLRLHAMEPIEVQEGAQLLEDLIELRAPKLPSPLSLRSELRTYQMRGLEWLWFLYAHQLSGLLCDEMGLGKTHQAMALISAIKKSQQKCSCLIICPTSVIFHWKEKLAQFLPDCRVAVFHGPERSLDDVSDKYDIVVTSYGIWRLEHPFLSQLSFDLAIFDEIQSAKNQSSRLHFSLRKVKAKMRLGMTGTPIENHLRELKSLFDLVLPGYMPSDADYRQEYVKPIEKERNERKRQMLTRLIHPFILRRRKRDVLLDLPQKIEEISHCTLSDDQKQLYSDLLLRMNQQLITDLRDFSQPVSYLHIFSLLSSLKQICNHPATYLKEPLEWRRYQSGKWDLFVELLNEALESEQKVVVFSQYLGMLDIIADYLRENKISYATIRGSTIDRGKQVQRFQEDPECMVFLGSLQAAGLGIDLTAASVVIHYDRWWNPAKENQATDRVHRIGQKRGVQVYKLVTLNTFEERIDELIKKKQRLLEEIVGFDDQELIKRLDRDELLFLLGPLH